MEKLLSRSCEIRLWLRRSGLGGPYKNRKKGKRGAAEPARRIVGTWIIAAASRHCCTRGAYVDGFVMAYVWVLP